MKRSNLRLIIIVYCILLIGCAKNKDQPAPTTPTVSTNKGSFTWLPTPGSSVTADSAYYYASFTTILAFKNGNSIEMNLSAVTVGTYSFSSATGNTFTFLSGSTIYGASSGSCSIIAAANNKLSGSFNVNLVGGSVTAMTGSFTDILKK